MPKIPYQSAQSMLPVRTYGGKVSQWDTGMPQTGAGLGVLATQLENFQKIQTEAEDTRQLSNAKTLLAVQLGEYDNEWKNNTNLWSPELSKKLEDHVENIRKTVAGSIQSERVKQALQPGLETALAAAKVEGNYKINVLHAEKGKEDIANNGNALAHLLAMTDDPIQQKAIMMSWESILDDGVNARFIGADDRGKLFQQFNADAEEFKAVKMIQDDPDKAAEVLKNPSNFKFLDPTKQLALHKDALSEGLTRAARQETALRLQEAHSWNAISSVFEKAVANDEPVDTIALKKMAVGKIDIEKFKTLGTAADEHNKNLALGATKPLTQQGLNAGNNILDKLTTNDLYGAKQAFVENQNILTYDQKKEIEPLLSKGIKDIEDPMVQDAFATIKRSLTLKDANGNENILGARAIMTASYQLQQIIAGRGNKSIMDLLDPKNQLIDKIIKNNYPKQFLGQKGFSFMGNVDPFAGIGEPVQPLAPPAGFVIREK